MKNYSLNNFMTEVVPGHRVPSDMTNILDVENREHRALMLFPFINECLKIIQQGHDPYFDGYVFACSEISDLFIGERFVRAFELIKDYSSNYFGNN